MFGSPVLLPVFLLVNSVGTLFIGPFIVVFPILVRDYYGGDIGQLALLNMMFPVGAVSDRSSCCGVGGYDEEE